MKTGRERRKFTRYKIRRSVVAMLDPGGTREGHIIDISHGGLAFQYMSASDWHSHTVAVRIISDAATINLKSIHCHTVYDTIIEKSGPTPLVQKKLHGIQFRQFDRAAVIVWPRRRQRHSPGSARTRGKNRQRRSRNIDAPGRGLQRFDHHRFIRQYCHVVPSGNIIHGRVADRRNFPDIGLHVGGSTGAGGRHWN